MNENQTTHAMGFEHPNRRIFGKRFVERMGKLLRNRMGNLIGESEDENVYRHYRLAGLSNDYCKHVEHLMGNN